MISSNLQPLVSQTLRRTSLVILIPLPNLLAIETALIPATFFNHFYLLFSIFHNLL